VVVKTLTQQATDPIQPHPLGIRTVHQAAKWGRQFGTNVSLQNEQERQGTKTKTTD